jgi:ABC-2 type transport system permease protein
MKTYRWLVRREFWENPSIWALPAVLAALLTLAALFGRVDFGWTGPGEDAHSASGMVLFGFGAVFFAIMNCYSTWYLLDCLYNERKDRSILFWKSLPISDTASVLAKLFTALVAIPVVYFVAADVATLVVAFVVSVRASSIFGGSLWHVDLWLQLQALWIYLIVTTAIWYLPVAAYLLVVSAWARRAVVLWSLLLPLALYVLERWFLGTHVVGTLMTERIMGYVSHAFRGAGRDSWLARAVNEHAIAPGGSVWQRLDPVGFVASPATWAGVIVGIALIAAAIQLRMRRTES